MFVNLQNRETILRRPVACSSIAVSLWVKVEAKRSKVSTWNADKLSGDT